MRCTLLLVVLALFASVAVAQQNLPVFDVTQSVQRGFKLRRRRSQCGSRVLQFSDTQSLSFSVCACVSVLVQVWCRGQRRGGLLWRRAEGLPRHAAAGGLPGRRNSLLPQGRVPATLRAA